MTRKNAVITAMAIHPAHNIAPKDNGATVARASGDAPELYILG